MPRANGFRFLTWLSPSRTATVRTWEPESTDGEGIFRLEVPGAGEYTVAIDPESFPEGVTLDDPEASSEPSA